MSAKTRAERRIKQFPTLEALVRGIWDGTQTPEDAEAILDSIGMGIGLKKRDAALAGAMERGPANMLEDPIYAQGLQDGFEAARRWQREGVDIQAMDHVDPMVIVRASGLGMAAENPEAARALEAVAKSQKSEAS